LSNIPKSVCKGHLLPEGIFDFQGELIRPGEPDYDSARRTWNGLIDKYPALIARCTGAEDVIAAVNFARKHELPLAVRGGGHDVAGNAVCDGGLVIDLSLSKMPSEVLKQVVVDPEACLARVGAGATLGEVDRVTQHYGLATPTGNVSATGIAGLTLSGGLGWLRRKYGMSVDNLLAVEMVTADGRLLRASQTEHPDLFWGVRGGGGNFGIVTRFEFRLHEVGPEVLFLTTMYPMAQAQEVLTAWRDWTLTAPEEASTDCLLWNIPASPPFPKSLHRTPVVILAGMYLGPAEEGLRLFQPLRALGDPVLDLTGPRSYLAVQSMFDPFFPNGLRYYWKSLYMDDINAEASAAIVRRARQRPSPQTLIPIRHIGGAISRVGDTGTAIANRRAQYLLSVDSTWDDPADDEKNIAWTRQVWAEMHQFSDGGVYLNFAGLGEENQTLVQAAHGANYARLVELKNTYDTGNLFRLNHNIEPTV
jgi:FAD/FMN-containing dehydrogenase